MSAFLTTALAVLVVELTDKTRLIALLLSARFRAPVQLIVGMTLGYIPATALAVFGVKAVTGLIAPSVLRWLLAGSFIACGGLLLWERGAEEKDSRATTWLAKLERLGPFWIGLLLVALTEFGDKSQLTTASLMLRYRQPWPVLLGSLSAQAILNVLYVGLGHRLGTHVPVRLIRRVAAAIFLLLGVGILLAWPSSRLLPSP